MNSPHLSDIALVVLAATRRSHPHLEQCAFCREQYDALVAMEAFEAEAAPGAENAPGAGESEHAGADAADALPYRLAAQSDVDMDTDLVLRRTWYLDDGHVLLRVFEEEAARLVGYVICAPERLASLRFRFSGLSGAFTPGADGSFAIGPADLPIEPMTVTLEEAP